MALIISLMDDPAGGQVLQSTFFDNFEYGDSAMPAIPVPGALLLMGTGLAGLSFAGKKTAK